MALAALFFALVTWTSYARWANFEYRTFDLAYYVQAVWQLIHGRFDVSVEHVPLLGNHVEPIVFLLAPLFALFRHPMLFVVLQNAALAAMAPIGYRITRRLGFNAPHSLLLGATLLLTPATGYIALHEFHPEALTAPFLLLMLDARLARSLWRHWIWFIAVLACKENMALLLAAYGVVHLVIERHRPVRESARWNLWPLIAALLWFGLCSYVITPAFNSGNIDYVTLYDRLGRSSREILQNAFTQPQLIGRALFSSLRHGNLLWALLFPFLALPLLRPRWLVISSPILLQHLLSWRSSEWTIYFHYAAPLLPLFWMATVEAGAKLCLTNSSAPPAAPAGPTRFALPWPFPTWCIPEALLIACVIGQAWFGPAAAMAEESAGWSAKRSDRVRKSAFIDQIPGQASVVAPLPYLSHLAMREKLYSLHYILKGLKTLSHASYEPPPPTDYVLIDYNDAATFDAGAGYYHPAMQTKDGRVVPSSDRLLHDFLKQSRWTVDTTDELTSFKKHDRNIVMGIGLPPPDVPDRVVATMDSHTELTEIYKTSANEWEEHIVEFQSAWFLQGERDVFPWMVVRLKRDGEVMATLTRGLCVPEANDKWAFERWHVASLPALPAATYAVDAVFVNNAQRAWMSANGQTDLRSTVLSRPIPLGNITIK